MVIGSLGVVTEIILILVNRPFEIQLHRVTGQVDHRLYNVILLRPLAPRALSEFREGSTIRVRHVTQRHENLVGIVLRTLLNERLELGRYPFQLTLDQRLDLVSRDTLVLFGPLKLNIPRLRYGIPRVHSVTNERFPIPRCAQKGGGWHAL